MLDKGCQPSARGDARGLIYHQLARNSNSLSSLLEFMLEILELLPPLDVL